MINIDGKQIKLQIWDTVSALLLAVWPQGSLYVNAEPQVLCAGRARVLPVHHTVILQRCSRSFVGVRYLQVRPLALSMLTNMEHESSGSCATQMLQPPT